MNAALQLLVNIPLIEKVFTNGSSLADIHEEMKRISERVHENSEKFKETEYMIKELDLKKNAFWKSVISHPELLRLEEELEDQGVDDVGGHPSFKAKQKEIYRRYKTENRDVYTQHKILVNSMESHRQDANVQRFFVIIEGLIHIFDMRQKIIQSSSSNFRDLSKPLSSFRKSIKDVFKLQGNYSQEDGNEVFVRIINIFKYIEPLKAISSYFENRNLRTGRNQDFVEVYVQQKTNLLDEIIRIKKNISFGKIVIFKLFRMMADQQRICNEPVKYPMTFSLDESYSEDAVYHLYGVMVRPGASQFSGHYYALARDFQNPSPNWSEFNDSSVYPISSKDVLGYGTSVTMLIYVKQTEIPRIFYTDLPWYESTEDVDFLKEFLENSKNNETIPLVQERLDVLMGRKKSDSKSKKEMGNSYSDKNQENRNKENSKEWKASDDPSSFKENFNPESNNYGTVKYSSNSKSRESSSHDQKLPFKRDAITQDQSGKDASQDWKNQLNRSKTSSFSSSSSLPNTNQNESSIGSSGSPGSFEFDDPKNEKESLISKPDESNAPIPDSYMAHLKMKIYFLESVVNRLEKMKKESKINREQISLLEEYKKKCETISNDCNKKTERIDWLNNARFRGVALNASEEEELKSLTGKVNVDLVQERIEQLKELKDKQLIDETEEKELAQLIASKKLGSEEPEQIAGNKESQEMNEEKAGKHYEKEGKDYEKEEIKDENKENGHKGNGDKEKEDKGNEDEEFEDDDESKREKEKLELLKRLQNSGKLEGELDSNHLDIPNPETEAEDSSEKHHEKAEKSTYSSSELENEEPDSSDAIEKIKVAIMTNKCSSLDITEIPLEFCSLVKLTCFLHLLRQYHLNVDCLKEFKYFNLLDGTHWSLLTEHELPNFNWNLVPELMQKHVHIEKIPEATRKENSKIFISWTNGRLFGDSILTEESFPLLSNCSHLNNASMITPSWMSKISASCLKSLRSILFSAFSSLQVASIPSSLIAQVPHAFYMSMPSAQLSGLTEQQIKSMKDLYDAEKYAEICDHFMTKLDSFTDETKIAVVETCKFDNESQAASMISMHTFLYFYVFICILVIES